MSKKLLIITYYWPPSGGAGVQRWLKFVKYLREFEWEPVVYTVANGEFPEIDNSLEKDIPENITVLKQPTWEPYNFYKIFIGRKKNEKIHAGFLTEKKKIGLLQNIAVWIRGNIFIPDARMFWIKPSVKFLQSYLSKNKVDAMVSTGPPHSCHLIALALKNKMGIKWLADFRDPWTNIDFYKDLKLTSWADKKHQRLEKEVVAKADCVLTIGKTMQEEFAKQFNRNIELITNGFDEEDISEEKVLDKKFSIAHIGTMVKTRNPVVLWKSLSDLIKEGHEIKNNLELKLVGKVDYVAQQSIEEFGLTQFVNRIDYMTHDEVTRVQQQSQILLLIVNNTPNAKGVITGKIFEYLLAKRPVICIGPVDGDAAHVINETNAGEVVNYDDTKKMKAILLQYYQLFKVGKLNSESKNVEKYSRKNLTKQLSNILNKL